MSTICYSSWICMSLTVMQQIGAHRAIFGVSNRFSPATRAIGARECYGALHKSLWMRHVFRSSQLLSSCACTLDYQCCPWMDLLGGPSVKSESVSIQSS
jgi:hypothetical protein